MAPVCVIQNQDIILKVVNIIVPGLSNDLCSAFDCWDGRNVFSLVEWLEGASLEITNKLGHILSLHLIEPAFPFVLECDGFAWLCDEHCGQLGF